MKRQNTSTDEGTATKKRSETDKPSWEKLLRDTKAIDIAKQHHKSIITLDSNSSVKLSLKVLAENNILSAPVVKDNKMLGFVDVLDITGFILSTWKKHNLASIRAGKETVSLADEFFQTPISEVINFSEWDDPVMVLDSSPVSEVIECLASSRRHFRAHRVAVLNKEDKVINIVSQSDVVSFAAQHLDLIPSYLKDKTMQQLRHVLRRPILVRLDTPASDTLETLYDSRVSGIALVNYEGKIAGNFSASDLRGILPEAFHLFSGSILQFMARGTDSRMAAPIVCTPDATLGEVIQRVVAEKVHRMYVVDENSHPLGVITLTDILHLLHPS